MMVDVTPRTQDQITLTASIILISAIINAILFGFIFDLFGVVR